MGQQPKICHDKQNSQSQGPRAGGCPAVIRAGYWNKVLRRNEVREVDIGWDLGG